jgi:1-phosphofructokinase family hexose kinase
MPRKIITVTLNSSIDVIVELPRFIENFVLDADSIINIAAGKGINVARALGALGERVIAIGIVGKESKKVFSAVASRYIHTDFISTDGVSRRNITIIQDENGAITHIRSKGYTVDSTALSRILRTLRSSVDKNDIVVFCGSLPKGMHDGTYAEYINLCKAKGAFTILDTAETPLRNAVAAVPRMIKCNKQEFQATFGLPPQCDDSAIIQQMNNLVYAGISYVVVTLGSDGVLALKENDENALKANLVLGSEYAGRKAVGSGDALLAGLAYGIKKKMDTARMIQWGVACGAANMFSKIPGDIDVKKVKKLLKQVQIEFKPT